MATQTIRVTTIASESLRTIRMARGSRAGLATALKARMMSGAEAPSARPYEMVKPGSSVPVRAPDLYAPAEPNGALPTKYGEGLTPSFAMANGPLHMGFLSSN